MAIQLSLRRPGERWPGLADVLVTSEARRLVAGTPQRHLVPAGASWRRQSSAFAGPEGEHHVRSATPGVSGRRRHGLAGSAGREPAAAGGDPSFMNNVPDPTFAGKDLPTFKFALEKSDGKVIGNSYGKEATVAQLPISKGSPASRCGSSPARCANCTGMPPRRNGRSLRGARPHHRRRPKRPRRDQRFRPRRRLVLPARPRTCCNASATSPVTSS